MMSASPDAIRAAFREFDREIAAIPGVQAVSQTWGAVPLGDDDEQTFWFEGHPNRLTQTIRVGPSITSLEPGYLKALRFRSSEGRFFTDQDNEHSPQVVVIDDVFARKFFPNEDPIGKRIVRGDASPEEIVGVVGHVKQWGLDSDDNWKIRAQLYIPSMQMPDDFVRNAASGSTLIVRSRQAGAGLLDSIRHVSQQMSNEQIIFVPNRWSRSLPILSPSGASRWCFSDLRRVGVAARQRRNLWRHFLRRWTADARNRYPDGLRCTPVSMFFGSSSWAPEIALIGVDVGLVCALGLTRLMANLLYGVGPRDPITFVAVPAILIVVALLASYLPARRAQGSIHGRIALRVGEQMQELFQDLRYGWRMLLKTPGLSAIVVVMLALGIGANSAVFSIFSRYLLRPLPYDKPERISSPERRAQSGGRSSNNHFPTQTLRTFAIRNQVFSHDRSVFGHRCQSVRQRWRRAGDYTRRKRRIF